MKNHFKPYKSYSEIPITIQEYILTVSAKSDITSISIETINEFLSGLEEYYTLNHELYAENA